MWVTEEKWLSLWDAHRRIVEHLREYDAWSVYDHMQRSQTSPLQHQQNGQVPPVTGQEPSGATTKPEVGQKRQWDGSKPHQAFVHSLADMMRDASALAMNDYSGGGGQGGQHAGPPAQQNEKPYHHPGLDARGLNWHFASEHIQCREQPCTMLFCQICGFHGHTAAKCMKRFKQIPGLNLHGYFQETKPNSPPVRYESRMSQGGDQARAPPPYIHRPPPRANTVMEASAQHEPHSSAQQAQQPPASQHQQQRANFPHFLNNTAPRMGSSRPHPDRQERMSRANQTNGGGGSAYDAKPSGRDSQ
jgi:hypothetical protein